MAEKYERGLTTVGGVDLDVAEISFDVGDWNVGEKYIASVDVVLSDVDAEVMALSMLLVAHPFFLFQFRNGARVATLAKRAGYRGRKGRRALRRLRRMWKVVRRDERVLAALMWKEGINVHRSGEVGEAPSEIDSAPGNA